MAPLLARRISLNYEPFVAPITKNVCALCGFHLLAEHSARLIWPATLGRPDASEEKLKTHPSPDQSSRARGGLRMNPEDAAPLALSGAKKRTLRPGRSANARLPCSYPFGQLLTLKLYSEPGSDFRISCDPGMPLQVLVECCRDDM